MSPKVRVFLTVILPLSHEIMRASPSDHYDRRRVPLASVRAPWLKLEEGLANGHRRMRGRTRAQYNIDDKSREYIHSTWLI